MLVVIVAMLPALPENVLVWLPVSLYPDATDLQHIAVSYVYDS
jgi:hypothetical protein